MICRKPRSLYFRGVLWAEAATEEGGFESAEEIHNGKSIPNYANDFDKGVEDYFKHYVQNKESITRKFL